MNTFRLVFILSMFMAVPLFGFAHANGNCDSVLTAGSVEFTSQEAFQFLLTNSYVEVEVPNLLDADAAEKLLNLYGSLPDAQGRPFGFRQGYSRSYSINGRNQIFNQLRKDARIAPLLPAFEWANQMAEKILAPTLTSLDKPLVVDSAVAIVKKSGVRADPSTIHTDDGLATILIVLKPTDNPQQMTRRYLLSDLVQATADYEKIFWTWQTRQFENVYWGGAMQEYYGRKSDARSVTPGQALIFTGNNWPESFGRIQALRHGAPLADWRGRQIEDRIAIAITYKKW